MLNALADCACRTPEVTEKNRQLALRMTRYYNLRMRCRRFWRPFRFLGWMPSLLCEYFRVGTSWRALMRDLVF